MFIIFQHGRPRWSVQLTFPCLWSFSIYTPNDFSWRYSGCFFSLKSDVSWPDYDGKMSHGLRVVTCLHVVFSSSDISSLLTSATCQSWCPHTGQLILTVKQDILKGFLVFFCTCSSPFFLKSQLKAFAFGFNALYVRKHVDTFFQICLLYWHLLKAFPPETGCLSDKCAQTDNCFNLMGQESWSRSSLPPTTQYALKIRSFYLFFFFFD